MHGPPASEGHRTGRGEKALAGCCGQEGHCSLWLWQRVSHAREPGAEQLLCPDQICAPLKAAGKLERIQKRTIELGQRLEMILHKERELFLLQLSRKGV